MNIVFRTDASLKIGTGHVIRSMTLACALRKRGLVCQFVCRGHEGNLTQIIQKDGFKVTNLRFLQDESSYSDEQPRLAHADWLGTDWETDAQQTIDAIQESSVDWIVIDHYALDVRWEQKLRPFVKRIMVVDDLADRPHDCDVLLDQNFVANFAGRYNGLLPLHCSKLLGPKYALLQPQYPDLHPRTPPRTGPIERILIYFGGVDQQSLTGMAIEAILALERPEINVDVVLNSASPNWAEIQGKFGDRSSICLHESLPSLAILMLKADLAIGAAGATSWERCCLGLPSIVITLAENQRPIAKELSEGGYVTHLGNHDQVSVADIRLSIEKYLNSDTLEERSRRCLDLVDGNGTARVAEILLLNANSPLTARLATLADEALLLEWANDPVVRMNAFNSDAIDGKTHRKWFYNRLRRPETCKIFIVEADGNLEIGQVRFEKCESAWEIHYGMAAFARGKQLGQKLLETAMCEFRKDSSEQNLFGRVKMDNIPSQRIFEKLGFACQSDQGMLIYTKSFAAGAI